jgi:hypothetical protein
MLRELIVRDLVLSRRALVGNGVVFLAFLAYQALGDGGPRPYTFFASLMMLFLPVTVLTREDLAKAAGATCTLPVGRDEVVRARYAMAWLLMAAGVAVAQTIGTVLPGSNVGGGVLFAPGQLLLALATVGLASALLLPFVIRFGFMGVIVFLVSAQGLGIVVMLLAMSGSHAPGRSLGGVIAAVRAWLTAAKAAAGAPLFAAGVVAVVAAVTAASYLASAAMFRRKEL